jgi:hypothetical protein
VRVRTIDDSFDYSRGHSGHNDNFSKLFENLKNAILNKDTHRPSLVEVNILRWMCRED